MTDLIAVPDLDIVTRSGMPVSTIHSFLVHAGKNRDDAPEPSGTAVPKKAEKLFRMLSGIYDQSPEECKIDISFNPDANGKQRNDRRTEVLAYLDGQNMKTGRAIARALQAVTTGRSGDGLLFLMAGTTPANKDRIVISRFPADTGITAEQGTDGLDVQFVERVFMKNATAYKAVMFEGTSRDAHFWAGKTVDKQLNSTLTALSEYWIKDFLQADFRTTSLQGTRRLAVAFRQASKSDLALAVKNELVSAGSLLKKYDGKSTSPANIAEEFGLSDAAVAELKKKLGPIHLFGESFKFDHAEFQKHAAYRTDELNNGALLSAPADEFDEIFEQHADEADGSQTRYTTVGALVEQKLRKGGP